MRFALGLFLTRNCELQPSDRANHLLLRNCIERFAEFKPHLLDSGHFKLQIVLLIGEMRKGTSERCLSSLIDREAAHWVAQDTNAGRI